MAGHADLDQRPFDQIGPVVDLHRLVRQRQFVEPVFGIQPLDDHLHHGVGPGRHVELPQRDDPLLAAGELDEHVVAPDGHHAAALDRVGLEQFLVRLAAAAQQLVHRRVAHGPIQLGVDVHGRRGRGTRDEGRGVRGEGRGAGGRGRGFRGESRGARGEGRGARDEGRGVKSGVRCRGNRRGRNSCRVCRNFVSLVLFVDNRLFVFPLPPSAFRLPPPAPCLRCCVPALPAPFRFGFSAVSSTGVQSRFCRAR